MDGLHSQITLYTKGLYLPEIKRSFFCTVIELVDVHNLMEIVFPLLKSFLE